jgi:hypothetical protein
MLTSSNHHGERQPLMVTTTSLAEQQQQRAADGGSNSNHHSLSISMGSFDSYQSDSDGAQQYNTATTYQSTTTSTQDIYEEGHKYVAPLKGDPSISAEAEAGTGSSFRTTKYPSFIEIGDSLSKRDTLSSSSTKSLWSRVDKGAFQFALRMATMLTISSLFVLIQTDTIHYPDGMWVLVSVLFVCWFPALDAASVIEKIIQRLIGTFVGAFLGLGCGFLSLILWNTRTQQATFLAVCMFVFNFGIIFLAGQCKVGPLKVIKKFAYATILCVLTFCISMIPFGTPKVSAF